MKDEKWIKSLKHFKIIAIDPGKEGGIAVYDGYEHKLLEVIHMPETPLFLEQFLNKYKNNSKCFLEKVGGLPGMGASRMFNFGQGFGQIEMCLICKKIPTVEVTPQKWQKQLQLGNKGKKTTNQWKSKLMERAQQLYPSIGNDFSLKTKKDWLRVSDALLILKYAREELNYE